MKKNLRTLGTILSLVAISTFTMTSCGEAEAPATTEAAPEVAPEVTPEPEAPTCDAPATCDAAATCDAPAVEEETPAN